MVQKPIVFISYTDELDLRHTLVQILTNFEVIISEWNIRSGESLKAKVTNDLEKADAVIVIWNEGASKSQWVNQEIGYAIAKGKKIIPVVDEKAKDSLKALLADMEYIPLIREKLEQTALIVGNRLTEMLITPVIKFDTYLAYCDWWMTIDESKYINEGDYAYWQTQHDLWSYFDYNKESIYLDRLYKTLIRGNTAFDKNIVKLYRNEGHIAVCGVTEIPINTEVCVFGNLVVETYWDQKYANKINSFLEDHNGDTSELLVWYGKISKEKTNITVRLNYSPEVASHYKRACDDLLQKYISV